MASNRSSSDPASATRATRLGRSSTRLAAVGLVGLAFLARPASALPFFVPLGDLVPEAVSEDGRTVVGSANGEAAIWTAGSGLRGLGVLPGTNASAAYDVSADGSVVAGSAHRAGTEAGEAFRWTEATGLQPLGAAFVPAMSGDGGTIVGGPYRWRIGQGLDTPFAPDATGHVFDATDITFDGRVVVGLGSPDFEFGLFDVFRWQGGSSTQFDAGASCCRLRVSANGLVAVFTTRIRSVPDSETTIRFVFGGTAIAVPPVPGHVVNFVRDVSGDGSIIVGRSEGADRGFIWDAAHGSRNVDEALASLGLDVAGWTFTSATALSDDGRFVVGSAIDPEGRRQGWLAMIPEPGTLALLATGLVVLSARRRARRPAS